MKTSNVPIVLLEQLWKDSAPSMKKQLGRLLGFNALHCEVICNAPWNALKQVLENSDMIHNAMVTVHARVTVTNVRIEEQDLSIDSVSTLNSELIEKLRKQQEAES